MEQLKREDFNDKEIELLLQGLDTGSIKAEDIEATDSTHARAFIYECLQRNILIR